MDEIIILWLLLEIELLSQNLMVHFHIASHIYGLVNTDGIDDKDSFFRPQYKYQYKYQGHNVYTVSILFGMKWGIV